MKWKLKIVLIFITLSFLVVITRFILLYPDAFSGRSYTEDGRLKSRFSLSNSSLSYRRSLYEYPPWEKKSPFLYQRWTLNLTIRNEGENGWVSVKVNFSLTNVEVIKDIYIDSNGEKNLEFVFEDREGRMRESYEFEIWMYPERHATIFYGKPLLLEF